MQFTIPVRELKEALPELRKVVQRKSSLPILETVHIQRDKGDTRLTATDLDIRLTYTIPSELPEPTSDLGKKLQANRSAREDCEICVHAKDLVTATKNADKNSLITFSAETKTVNKVTGITDKGKETTEPTAVTASKLTYLLNGNPATLNGFDLEPDEFPPPRKDFKAVFYLTDAVRDSIVTALQCASTDATRYVLNGVYIHPEKHAVIATDGKQLIRFETTLPPELPTFIMPSKAVNACSGRISKLPWRIATSTDDPKKPSAFEITAGNWTLQSRTIEGNYPNYPQVIPVKDEKGASIYKINTYNLLNASDMLKRLPVNTDDQWNAVLVSVKGDTLRFKVKDSHFDVFLSSGNGTNPRQVNAARPLWQRLIDLGSTEIRIVDEMNPVVGYNDNNPLRRMTYVFMPVRLSS